MSSTIVYQTSTEAARRKLTGLAGINRVAGAATFYCPGCGCCSNSGSAMDEHIGNCDECR